MKYTNDQLKLVANTIRCLAADMVEKAASGHPGVALGLAECRLLNGFWQKAALGASKNKNKKD